MTKNEYVGDKKVIGIIKEFSKTSAHITVPKTWIKKKVSVELIED
jgi:hypothetical protein